jgi:hypothetical protein
VCKYTGALVMRDDLPGNKVWVWKYEVSARKDGGRNWFSLGAFDGNKDAITEVAHRLLEPVVCRFLRFRVLGYDRVPAMRVGVYGKGKK